MAHIRTNVRIEQPKVTVTDTTQRNYDFSFEFDDPTDVSVDVNDVLVPENQYTVVVSPDNALERHVHFLTTEEAPNVARNLNLGDTVRIYRDTEVSTVTDVPTGSVKEALARSRQIEEELAGNLQTHVTIEEGEDLHHTDEEIRELARDAVGLALVAGDTAGELNWQVDDANDTFTGSVKRGIFTESADVSRQITDEVPRVDAVVELVRESNTFRKRKNVLTATNVVVPNNRWTVLDPNILVDQSRTGEFEDAFVTVYVTGLENTSFTFKFTDLLDATRGDAVPPNNLVGSTGIVREAAGQRWHIGQDATNHWLFASGQGSTVQSPYHVRIEADLPDVTDHIRLAPRGPTNNVELEVNAAGQLEANAPQANDELPPYAGGDRGQFLQVTPAQTPPQPVSLRWAPAPVELPAYGAGDVGEWLRVAAGGTSTEWADLPVASATQAGILSTTDYARIGTGGGTGSTRTGDLQPGLPTTRQAGANTADYTITETLWNQNSTFRPSGGGGSADYVISVPSTRVGGFLIVRNDNLASGTTAALVVMTSNALATRGRTFRAERAVVVVPTGRSALVFISTPGAAQSVVLFPGSDELVPGDDTFPVTNRVGTIYNREGVLWRLAAGDDDPHVYHGTIADWVGVTDPRIGDRILNWNETGDGGTPASAINFRPQSSVVGTNAADLPAQLWLEVIVPGHDGIYSEVSVTRDSTQTTPTPGGFWRYSQTPGEPGLDSEPKSNYIGRPFSVAAYLDEARTHPYRIVANANRWVLLQGQDVQPTPGGTPQVVQHATNFAEMFPGLTVSATNADTYGSNNALAPEFDLDADGNGRGEFHCSLELTIAPVSDVNMGFIQNKPNQTAADRSASRSNILFASDLSEAMAWSSADGTTRERGLQMFRIPIYSGTTGPLGFYEVFLTRDANNVVSVYHQYDSEGLGGTGAIFSAELRISFTPSDAASGGGGISGITVEEDGTRLGTAGTVDTINAAAGIAATRTGNEVALSGFSPDVLAVRRAGRNITAAQAAAHFGFELQWETAWQDNDQVVLPVAGVWAIVNWAMGRQIQVRGFNTGRRTVWLQGNGDKAIINVTASADCDLMAPLLRSGSVSVTAGTGTQAVTFSPRFAGTGIPVVTGSASTAAGAAAAAVTGITATGFRIARAATAYTYRYIAMRTS